MAVVVAAAILRSGRVLVCRRSAATDTGLWEFPGGKVEPGESESTALARECAEELGLAVAVGDRIGADTPIAVGVLRLYRCTADGEPTLRPGVHDATAWASADEVAERPWIPADLTLVAEVRALLASG